DENCAKVSVVGLGMAKQTGVAQQMFRSLADAGINIQMITTSEIKISVLVAREQGQPALRIVHQAFELQKPPTVVAKPKTPAAAHGDVADVVARLQGVEGMEGMEDLTIDDVVLDDTQA